MSRPAVKRVPSSANDADYDKPLDIADGQKTSDGVIEPPKTISSIDNPVKRAIEEFRELIDEMDDIREVLRAHGIPLRTTRMMVEFGVQNKPDKQAMAIDSAMEQAEKSLGEAALKRQVVENHLSTIVSLERDLTHARSAAKEEGLDVTALAILTQMVQQNPGDGGAKAVNTFLGYALAFGVKTDQLAAVAGELTQRPDSVLPQIPRKADITQLDPRKKLAQDAAMGLVIGIIIISMLL